MEIPSFTKLEELFVTEASDDNTLKKILSSTNSLKRLKIGGIEENIDWNELLQKIFGTQPSLEYLRINDEYDEFDDICDAIEYGMDISTFKKDGGDFKLFLYSSDDKRKRPISLIPVRQNFINHFHRK